MTDKALTPRTDAKVDADAVSVYEDTPVDSKPVAYINADFARSLESELSAAQQKLDRYTRLSEIGESLGGQLEEMEARIAAQQENQRLREERDEIVETLKRACDRDWGGETPRQVAVIAANGLWWRGQAAENYRLAPTTAAQGKAIIEECAKVCEETDDVEVPHSYDAQLGDAAATRRACAAAIRALNPKEEHHKGGKE